MAKFNFIIARDASGGEQGDVEAFLRVSVHRMNADESLTHVATYELRWHENLDATAGDGTYRMSCTTLFWSDKEASGSYDLDMMVRVLKEINDAFDDEKEFYSDVFQGEELQEIELEFEIDNGR